MSRRAWLVAFVALVSGCAKPATGPKIDPEQGHPSVGKGGPDAVKPPPDRMPPKM